MIDSATNCPKRVAPFDVRRAIDLSASAPPSRLLIAVEERLLHMRPGGFAWPAAVQWYRKSLRGEGCVVLITRAEGDLKIRRER